MIIPTHNASSVVCNPTYELPDPSRRVSVKASLTATNNIQHADHVQVSL